jgi:hypothetical protein
LEASEEMSITGGGVRWAKEMSIAAKTTLTTTETMSNGPRRINLFYSIGGFGQMQKGNGGVPKQYKREIYFAFDQFSRWVTRASP